MGRKADLLLFLPFPPFLPLLPCYPPNGLTKNRINEMSST